jgi:hypothetical protein
MPLSYEDAQQLILAQIRPLPAETVPLLEALGRAVAVAVIAPFDLPHFDNSAMDGYALRAVDSGPGKTLTVSGYLAAGSLEQPPVEPGCAVRIMTGAPVLEIELVDDSLLVAGRHQQFRLRYRKRRLTGVQAKGDESLDGLVEHFPVQRAHVVNDAEAHLATVACSARYCGKPGHQRGFE